MKKKDNAIKRLGFRFAAILVVDDNSENATAEITTKKVRRPPNG